jgi:hypothetical protein
VLVLALVVLVLFVAYRSLGGATRNAEPNALLTSAATSLRTALTDLSAALDAATALDADGSPADASRDGRRASAAAQQLLDRLPTGDDLDERDATIRTLLAAAAEDASWAWRMIAAGTTSPGVTAAVVALHDHAGMCCAWAEGLLPAPAGEPLDSP